MSPPEPTTRRPVDELPSVNKQWPTSHVSGGQISANSAAIIDIKPAVFIVIDIVVIHVSEIKNLPINLSSTTCSSKSSPLFFVSR